MRAPAVDGAALEGDPGAGFTLIEVLVAFTIAALMLGALYQLFSTGLRSSAAAENYETAMLLAESGIDALTATALTPGETDNRIGRFERRTRVTRRPELSSTQALSVPVPFEVEVSVTWHEGVRARSVRLATLRPGPQDSPQ